MFLEEGNFEFYQAIWVLADLFPALSMSQSQHFFPVYFNWELWKSIGFLVSSHTQEQTYTYQLILKDGKQCLQPSLHVLKWLFVELPRV